MGCVVNGPGEAEGADVAVFAGKGRGVIYVQGEQVRTVTESEMLDALYDEAVKFAAKVERGEAQLRNTLVEIKPPAPIGPLGSGYDKIKSGGVSLPVRET
jgi:(E)-4-hydroxy-3-methylbut-2-enyl-diphosphate synthase